MMRITKIELKNFRAFRGEYTIDLHGGKNLLVYGENGSGKSSLYEALNRFFADPTPFVDHKNIFVTSADGFVKLDIGDGTNPATTYEWEETTHPFSQLVVGETSKTKGFLDYRALLETHFAHRRAQGVNVFDLLIRILLANTTHPILGIPLGEAWRAIERLRERRRTPPRNERLTSAVAEFSAGVTALLPDLTTKANQILGVFQQNVTVQLTMPIALSLDAKAQEILNQDINLTTEYYGRGMPRHHHFLNEARLSAIAISIYLGALLLNPPSSLRVLFLDDVLLGLDMSNRLPLLEVLSQDFSEWQIFLTTYDRVWFEMARMRLENGAHGWEKAEFFCAATSEGDLPVYQQSKDYLGAAKKHLLDNDLKAAAIYVRSAYEYAIKRFCDKHNLPVDYCENPKRQKSDDFWQVVKRQRHESSTQEILPPTLVSDIELYRSSILNQLSHTEPVAIARHEVEAAWKAVENLKQTLGQIQKGTLAR